MAYVIPNDATHAAVVTINFADGEPEGIPVAFGSFEECDGVARERPVTIYKGERQATTASIDVYALKPMHACGQRHDESEGCAIEAGMAADMASRR